MDDVLTREHPGPGTGGRRFGLRALLGLVALLAGAVPFLALWLLVVQSWSPLASLDGEVADDLNEVVSRTPGLTGVLQAVTDLGGNGFAVLAFTLTAVFLAVRGRRRLLVWVLATGAGLAVLVPTTKALVDRARPVVDSPVVEVPSNASFPSGHAMTSLVTWGVLLLLALPAVGRRARPWLVAGAVLVVVAVGFTRLALGVHFVSDVLAGWALGLAWLAATAAAARLWHDEDRTAAVPADPLHVGARGSEHLAPSGQRVLPRGRSTVVRLLGAAAALFALVAGTGLVVTGPLAGTPLGSLDLSSVRTLVELRTPARSDVAVLVSSLSGTRAVIVVSLTLAVVSLAVTRSWRPVVFVGVAVVGEVLLYAASAQVVGRLRPAVPDLTTGLPVGASWPSGHTAAAAAVYGALAVLVIGGTRGRRRWAVLLVPAVLVPAIGASRVYVAAHHPTDVVAGAVLGGVWVVVCALLLLRDRAPAPR